MDRLNPVLRCLLVVEESVARGESVRDGLLVWLNGESALPETSFDKAAPQTAFRDEILEFLRKHERNEGDSPAIIGRNLKTQSVCRQTFFSLLDSGMAGQPILPNLKELRDEVEAQLELDMKAHIESLPLKTLAPLLLCMFPAFLILLLGPITRNFLEALK